MKQPVIELINVSRKFVSPVGKTVLALKALSLSIQEGEFCAIVGPTGCGKSTTLGMITGISPPSSGVVKVFNREVKSIDPRIGFVFQTDAVFPWKNVLDNVALGPIYRGVNRQLAKEKALHWINLVGLTGFEYHYPHQLSGGMKKRVALAQTFINDPKILLMDEPFSALDVQTRALMQEELLKLCSENKASVVFVTHDIEEALTLADTVVVLSKGPAIVKRTYQVPFTRPRNVIQARHTPEFIELSRNIWEDLRTEVTI